MSIKKTIIRNSGMIIALMFLSAFVLYWWLNSPRLLNAMFLIVAAPLLVFFVLLAFGKIRLDDATVFLISLTVLGLCFCFIFPPMTVPDEGFHYLSTYWVVDCLTGKGSFSSSDVLLRHDDWLFYSKYSYHLISSNSYMTIVNKFSFFCSAGSEHVVTDQAFSLGGINVSAKLFTIIGMLLGKVLNLGAYPTFYLGRLFSLGSFIAAAYVSFKIAPKGKSIIAFVSLLPMTLHLAGSLSYDCGIIAYSLLIFSFLMRGFFGEEGSIGGEELFAYCAVTVLLAPCKVIYSCICILGLLIPTSKFTSKKFAYLSKGASCVAIVVAVCVMRLASISTLAAGSDISHRGTETGHFYTVAEIIQHPLHSFRVLFRSFDQLGDFWSGSIIGNSLGWFQGDITVPYFFMVPYLGMGALCCSESHDEDVCLAKKTSAWFVVAFALVFLGAIFSMWIGWTFNTEDVVKGMQGRYLLPALPMLLFALRSNRLVYKGQAFRCVLCGMSIMNLIYLVRLFSIVASI